MKHPKKKLRKQLRFPSKEIKELKFKEQNLYTESCKKLRKKLKELYKQSHSMFKDQKKSGNIAQ